MSFDSALTKTLGHEGGISNNPLDTGGLTNRGVTQYAYDRWREKKGRPKTSVVNLTYDEAREFYLSEYWLASGCDKLPEPISDAVFDMAVNSGVSRAVRTLQKVLFVEVDGVVGPATIKAAEASPGAFIDYLKARASFYRDIIKNDPSQIEFMAGWVSRLLDQAWKA